MKRTLLDKLGDFVLGKGFYIVLFLCVAAIGISGYYLMEAAAPDLSPAPVAGNPHVVLPDTTLTQPKVQTPPAQVKPKETSPQQEQIKPAQPETSPQPEPTAEPVVIPEPKEEAAYLWPLEGEVLRGFSLEVLAYDETMGDWRTHCGIDIAGEEGSKVSCIGDGIIKAVYSHDLMGNTVVVDHQDGTESLYSNLSPDPAVSVGQEIERGDTLGTVGRTALAESALPAHLHLEMTRDGDTADPVNFLPAR